MPKEPWGVRGGEVAGMLRHHSCHPKRTRHVVDGNIHVENPWKVAE